MTHPRISVVMAVYNGAERLDLTLDSIFAQTMADFELVVVDDGSTDATPEILRRRLDSRLRVFTHAKNEGLTFSLIRGCSESRGSFIARQDAGDVSHPERFARQLAAFDDSQVVLVGCTVRFRGPGGESLYDVGADEERLRDGLLHGDAGAIRSLPHHGSAMFRRESYRQAGDYRQVFRYAQDLDLWIRLAHIGRIVVLPEILYEAVINAGSLSAVARDAQQSLTHLAVRIRDARDDGETTRLLGQAERIRRRSPRSRASDARAFYFIASCLLRKRDGAWRRYAVLALKKNPLQWRAWTLFPRALWRRVAAR